MLSCAAARGRAQDNTRVSFVFFPAGPCRRGLLLLVVGPAGCRLLLAESLTKNAVVVVGTRSSSGSSGLHRTTLSRGALHRQSQPVRLNMNGALVRCVLCTHSAAPWLHKAPAAGPEWGGGSRASARPAVEQDLAQICRVAQDRGVHLLQLLRERVHSLCQPLEIARA